ncbi:MAG: hypothetical protein ACPHQD_17020 [Vibrio toranzoniae]|uniref:hypothetical protein n=1 Tax=Vibrio toranzoniae TaxID=1194427 RepID=UPI003C3F09AC
MTEQVTMDSALSGLTKSMTSQFEGIQKLFENNIAIVQEALNNDNDEYNDLVDECKRLQGEKNTLELALNSQKDAHKEAYQELEVQLAEKIRLLTAANLKLSTYTELKEQNKKLKALNPERLQKSLKETKSKNQDLMKDNQKLRSDNKKYRTENSTLTILNSKLESAATEVHNQYKHMADLLNHDDGEVVQKAYKGKQGVECFINVFSYPLSYKAVGGEIVTVNDFDFHVEIKTNIAINLTVSCSSFGIPFLPDCKDLQGLMPESLMGAVQSIYLDRMGKNHSYLLDRIEAMQDVGLNEVIGLTERQVELLNKSDYYSVFSVVHTPKPAFIKAVKGLGNKTAQEVIDLCNAYVREWEQTNWSKEQIKKYGTK